MESDHNFLKQLREKRTAFSQSSEKFEAVPSYKPPISGLPFYYIEAVENFHVPYPYYVEREGIRAYYILYTIEGQGQLIYKGHTVTLDPGSVFFIDCASRYRIEISGQTPWKFSSVYLNGPSVFYYYQTFAKDNRYTCNISALSPVGSVLLKLNDVLPHFDTFDYDFLISKLVTDLLTNLIEARGIERQMSVQIPKYVLDVKKQFDDACQNNYSLDSLATSCRISKYQLSHEFTKHIGVSPINYLIGKRMEKAKELLTETDETIGTIGLMVGIENTTHFINLFKKEVGVTPLQYRKYALY